MDYEKMFYDAIKKGDFLKYLKGEWPYEIECSQYMSDIQPTDINQVLMRNIYASYIKMPNIKVELENALRILLNGSAVQVYTAILYFDACLFAEKQRRAAFQIDRDHLIAYIQNGIIKNEEDLKKEIEFPNGLVKKCAWNNLMYFNKSYQKDYGFKIFD